MITTKNLKKAWKNRKQHGGFTKHFRDMGETYADAAYLALQRK